MSNIIPFEGSALPAYLRKPNAAAINADLSAHASAGYAVISIKGKVFALVKDGERRILPNPKDPDSPATAIDVVLVKVNPKTSKVFYLKGYNEGEDAKPDCFSVDGTVPDPLSQTPQAKSCAVCSHNQWGSRISEQGKKGKACADSIRMAVATPDNLEEPMLLRVPAATMRAVGEYGNMLSKRGVPYQAVVTKISFDQEAATPKLLFKAVGFLAEEAATEAIELSGSDLAKSIVGLSPAVEQTPSAAQAEEPVTEEPAAQAAPAAKAVKAPKAPKADTKHVSAAEVEQAVEAAEAAGATASSAKAAPSTVTAPEVQIDLSDLDDLNFDD